MYFTIGCIFIAWIPALVGLAKIIWNKIDGSKFDWTAIIDILITLGFMIPLTILLADQMKRGV